MWSYAPFDLVFKYLCPFNVNSQTSEEGTLSAGKSDYFAAIAGYSKTGWSLRIEAIFPSKLI